ncbi:MAG: LLM class flavin-dependent oxidoreductase [Xanthobacteraceae bacterium]
MKNIGFLSFGHWTPSSQSQTRSAADALLQSIDLAVAAEELGADGAYFRVHHFARQLASPFPLLAAVGAKTSRIEIGTAVIDMRYENPLYMAEDAGAADLISGGACNLAVAEGRPSRSSMDGGISAINRPRARQMPIWVGAIRRSFLTCCAAKASRSPIRVRCFQTRRDCCVSNRTP